MKVFLRLAASCLSFIALMGTGFAEDAPSPEAVVKTTLYSFKGSYQYRDGAVPNGLGLVVAPGGVLYGVTQQGGLEGTCGGSGCGVVFKMTPPTPPATRWTETVIYRFKGGCDGAFPGGGALVRDASGALYGTTYGAFSGCGTVFKLTPPVPPAAEWTHTVLTTFPLAVFPGPLTRDPLTGALYGVTQKGGWANQGIVFKLSPPVPPATKWTRTTLYAFRGGADGSGPFGGMVFGTDGSLYGTTSYGGVDPARQRCIVGGASSGCGVVFRLKPPVPPQTNWTQSVLHRFEGYSDGAVPQGDLIRVGNALVGMTANGGAGNAGTIFRMSPPVAPSTSWTKTTLYEFPVRTTDRAALRGAAPYGRLVRDSTGALFGTTVAGGSYGSGVAFKLAPPVAPSTQWIQTVMHHFRGGADGVIPMGFVKDAAGGLYGVTGQGGAIGWGTVFKISGAAAP